jgi:predicted CoA-binding protein
MSELIQRFLGEERFAFVGPSRAPAEFSRHLFRDLVGRGYDVVPVSPYLNEVEGRPCFARLQDVAPPVRAALLLTSPAVTEQVVRDCMEAGVSMVWMHKGGGGTGAVSPEAVAFCRANGIEVIEGECPYMYLPKAGAVHRIHGFVRRLFGRTAAA